MRRSLESHFAYKREKIYEGTCDTRHSSENMDI